MALSPWSSTSGLSKINSMVISPTIIPITLCVLNFQQTGAHQALVMLISFLKQHLVCDFVALTLAGLAPWMVLPLDSLLPRMTLNSFKSSQQWWKHIGSRQSHLLRRQRQTLLKVWRSTFPPAQTGLNSLSALLATDQAILRFTALQGRLYLNLFELFIMYFIRSFFYTQTLGGAL